MDKREKVKEKMKIMGGWKERTGKEKDKRSGERWSIIGIKEKEGGEKKKGKLKGRKKLER